MDTRTGKIISAEDLQKLSPEERSFYKEVDLKYITPEQWKRKPPKVGRNDSCLCGSGKKFKKCCLK